MSVPVVELERVGVEDLAATQAAPSLFQSRYWARLKERRGDRPMAFHLRSSLPALVPAAPPPPGMEQPENGRETTVPLLALLRPAAAGATEAYVPSGPAVSLAADQHGPFLEELARQLARELPEPVPYIRFDLPWLSPFAEDCYGGPPETRVREMRMNFGTEGWNLRKSTTDIQPPDTVLVDLSKDDESLRSGMRPKTRYNIGLAERRGVTVREATANEAGRFASLYEETARRNRIALDDAAYFGEVLRVAESLPGKRTRVELLLASLGDDLLAGMILAIHGRRATYLYGASSSHRRSLMAPYALQWHAMRRARAAGATHYDLFGIPPADDPSHPMHGLYRFKTGFGGIIRHRRGCWDYVIDKTRYDEVRERESVARGFHR